MTCDFFSESLMVGTSITVVLPQETEEQIGLIDEVREGPPPVLYLLHGLSDDHTAWLRYTSIERYAVARGLAVVMPAAGRSFYADEAHGHRYWTYISEELPRVVGQFFRVSQEPADTFVAGLSMGGYGALKLALTHPDRYAAAACLSGALDLVAFSKRPDRDEVMGRVFDHKVDARVTTCSRCSPRRRRSRRSTSRAAPRTGCSRRASGSPRPRRPPASTSPPTSAPATTSGRSGTPSSRTSSPGSRAGSLGLSS